MKTAAKFLPSLSSKRVTGNSKLFYATLNIDTKKSAGTLSKTAKKSSIDPVKRANTIASILEAPLLDYSKYDPKGAPLPTDSVIKHFPNAQVRQENEKLEKNEISMEKIVAEEESRAQQAKKFKQSVKQFADNEFKPQNEKETKFFNIYNGKNKEEQETYLPEMLKWLFALPLERRTTFIRWLTEKKGRTDLTRRIQTAFMNMKVYKTHIQLESIKTHQEDRRIALNLMFSNNETDPNPYQALRSFYDREEAKAIYGDKEVADASDFVSKDEFISELNAQHEMPQGKRLRGAAIGANRASGKFGTEEFLKEHPTVDADDQIYHNANIYSGRDANPSLHVFDRKSYDKFSGYLRQVAARQANGDSIFGAKQEAGDFLGSHDWYNEMDEKNVPTNEELDVMMEEYQDMSLNEGQPEPILKELEKDLWASYSFHPDGEFHYIELKDWSTTVQKAAGRENFYSSYVVVGHPCGMVGLGYGRAPTPVDAKEKAMRNAYLNLQAFPKTTSGRPLFRLMREKYNKSLVIMSRSKYGSVRGHPILRKICEWIGLNYVTIKTHGSRNPINLMVALFKCFAKLKTEEDVMYGRGKQLMHLQTDTHHYAEQVRQGRGAYGWN